MLGALFILLISLLKLELFEKISLFELNTLLSSIGLIMFPGNIFKIFFSFLLELVLKRLLFVLFLFSSKIEANMF